jgi:hypothetical protein
MARKRETRTSRETLMRATRVHGSTEDGPVYSCQATCLKTATTPLPWWRPLQYFRDVWSRNISLRDLLKGLAILTFNKFQAANRKFIPGLLLIHGGVKYPFIEGTLLKTPKETQDLQPGELVRIRSKEEILRTLDTEKRNRGLSFDREMLRYCGRQARVLRRVERLIDEKSGEMTFIKSDCIILEGIYCRADYHEFCPRSIYHYWREIWLERVQPEPVVD